MASKKRSNSTGMQSSALLQALVETLRADLERAHERELAHLRIIEGLNGQIQMVLDDKYFHPVVQPGSERVRSTGGITDPETLNESTQFPTDGDRKAIETQREAEDKAREKFDDELAALEAEQEAWREQAGLPSSDDLDAVAAEAEIKAATAPEAPEVQVA